ncbi:MAG: hypothetical protein EWV50_06790 [Microcystis aeruginosa Ma_MB_F_20061100_S20]|uniref:Uncharacterized protein n=1 Tax=Microcystis aeruginosa Ma_MB_F_20061100_S20D TaxID=2486253 RepID=A0A552E955_MICAE|nr:MAG: hypothetical protein EWV78_21365 [Microcystis aeruginosa Ma_MB_F_20061100_S20D]TRU41214.1 MAG: hypothetical protein EWV50_06790 [Microcystis aeruginosa Ma_MB_F_20061100_S20]
MRKKNRKCNFSYQLSVISEKSGVSPDEKIFTPTDERGFLPYTRSAELTAEAHTLHPLSS